MNKGFTSIKSRIENARVAAGKQRHNFSERISASKFGRKLNRVVNHGIVRKIMLGLKVVIAALTALFIAAVGLYGYLILYFLGIVAIASATTFITSILAMMLWLACLISGLLFFYGACMLGCVVFFKISGDAVKKYQAPRRLRVIRTRAV